MYIQIMEGMYRRKEIEHNKISVASKEQINRLSRKFRKRGGEFIDDEDAIAYLNDKKAEAICTAPPKLDMKNLTFGVFFYEINL